LLLKIIIAITAILLPLLITGIDIVDVGGTAVGVISIDMPFAMQKRARTAMLTGAVNAVTFGSELEYSDENLTVVAGYCPAFGRLKGLPGNIQAAARSGPDGVHIKIGIPALPPDSY